MEISLMKIISLFLTFFLGININAQGDWLSDDEIMKPAKSGSRCEMEPQKTEQILNDLENRALCQSLTSADCLKLMGAAAGATVGGIVAAKKAMGFGRINLDPSKDIICTNSPLSFDLSLDGETKWSFFFNNYLIPRALSMSNIYCHLHPGAAYRSELEKLQKAMREEVEAERKRLYEKLIPTIDPDHAKALADGQQARSQMDRMLKDYLANFGDQVKANGSNPEVARVYEMITRQINESLAENPPNYRAARTQMRNAVEYMTKNGLPNMGSILPSPDAVKDAIDKINAERAVPDSSRNFKGVSSDQRKALDDIRYLFENFSDNEGYVRSELEKLRKKIPSVNVENVFAEYDTVRRKSRSADHASHVLMSYERDLRDVSKGAGINRKALEDGSEAAIKKSIELMNRTQGFNNFKTAKVALGVETMVKWGNKTKMMLHQVSSLTRAARTLSLAALVVGGKAALASTGVGLIPVALETAVEESVVRSITYSPEECLNGAATHESKLRQNSLGLLGFDYIDMSGTSCKPSGELGPKFNRLFELSPADRLRIVRQSDRLCDVVYQIHKAENRFAGFEARCTDKSGSFSLTDRAAAKANFNLIQRRSIEARAAGLKGTEYDNYIKGGLSSFDQSVKVSPIGLQVTYTMPTTALQSCSSFSADGTTNSVATNPKCTSYTKPVSDSVYDYALLTAQCSGQSDEFANLYQNNFKRGSGSVGAENGVGSRK